MSTKAEEEMKASLLATKSKRAESRDDDDSDNTSDNNNSNKPVINLKEPDNDNIFHSIGLDKDEYGLSAQEEEDTENAMDITSVDIDLDFTDEDGDANDAEIMKEILATEDLKQLCRDVESKLRGVDQEAVPEYLREMGNFTALYREINACDKLLASFEESLGAFQSVLLSINSDVKSLQESSVRTTQKIENRRAASEKIEDFVNRIFVSRTVRESLQKLSPGDPAFCARLADFNDKLAFFDLVMEEYADSPPRVCLELKPKYDALREQVGWKVQAYFLKALSGVTPSAAGSTGLGALRSAQASLLRDAKTYQFIFKHTPERAAELRERYIAVAAQYYEAYMRKYTAALLRCAIDAGTARKDDMLGALESHHRQRLSRSLFASQSSLQAARTVNIFALGDRGSVVLERIAHPPMLVDSEGGVPEIPHPSGGGSGDLRQPFEELWRSALRTLVDAAVAETLFVQDFFLAQQDVAELVLARPAAALEDFLGRNLAGSYDTIGIALMACVAERYNAVALRRNVACLADFNRRCTALISARYGVVMDAHTESLRKANPENTDPVTVAAPHFITRRYAEFLSALLTIAAPACKAPAAAAMIARPLLPMRREFERTLLRFAQSLKDPVLQTIFLMNNYDLVLVLLREHGVESEDAARFRELFQTCLQTFQDSIVISYSAFRAIANYLDEMRPLLDEAAQSGSGEMLVSHPHYTPDYVLPIIKDFHESWRKVVDKVLSDVLKYFSNFETGQETCNAVFKKLFGLYKEFLEFIKTNFKELLRSKFLVSETEIRYELKKLGISQ